MIGVHLVLALTSMLLALGAIHFARRRPTGREWTDRAAAVIGALAPGLFAVTTFLAGAILLFSGATPNSASRLGWLNSVLPLPLVEVSAYFASAAGVGLIILARGLQRRLDAAYHLAVWLLAGGIVFSLASALDIAQAIDLSVMLVILVPSRRFFYRRSSIFEERFTAGWIAAIAVVLIGTATLAVAHYGSAGLGTDVLWRFDFQAQGPRTQRALVVSAIVVAAFAAGRLLRPARIPRVTATLDDLAVAEQIIASSGRASALLATLGDKALLFNAQRTAFIMYAVSGRSWVSLGDPVGPLLDCVPLINEFVTKCDAAGGWAVFYRVPPAFLHLYLDYALSAVKLGEVAHVPLPDFSLEGPQRRNLRRVWRKAVDDGCAFEILEHAAVDDALPELGRISDAWLHEKEAREKRFSLGNFEPEFIRRGAIGVIRRQGAIVAFVTLWCSGKNAEVEVDLMRYDSDAPPGIMRYALIESMIWARDRGYASFCLGAAPLSGIRTSAVTPAWNQLSIAVRDVGERYYNFEGLRNFKDWFYPTWEPVYLVSPGGTRRPIIMANISALISGGFAGIFRK